MIYNRSSIIVEPLMRCLQQSV